MRKVRRDKTCIVPWCHRRERTWGLCNPCYLATKVGYVAPIGKPKPSVEERFWRRVDKENGLVHPVDGKCWTWVSYRGAKPKRYGSFFRNGALTGAHRASYEMHVGPVPPGLFVLHRCDNPPCVRPSHLFVGTVKDNGEDMARKGRSVKGRKVPSIGRPGELNVHSKIRNQDVLRIRELHAEHGVSSRSLAKQFGICKSSVNYIIRRESWTNI